MPKPKVGGYNWRQEINRAIRANRAARQALESLLVQHPPPRTLGLALTKASLALGENLDALQELIQIAQKTPPAGTSGDGKNLDE
jgi:hypothetical protein